MKKPAYRGTTLVALAVWVAAFGQACTRSEPHEGDGDAGKAKEHAHDRPDHGGHQDHPRHRPHHGPADAGPSVLGETIKDFTLTDNSGKAIRLAELGRTEQNERSIAVLTFWCTTCMSCRQMERSFNKKAKEYGEKGVLFFMVASNTTETSEQVNRFLKHNDLSFPVLIDTGSKVAWYFGAAVTTTTAVIDADGRIRYYGAFPKAEAAIRDLMAGKEVAMPRSPPTG